MRQIDAGDIFRNPIPGKFFPVSFGGTFVPIGKGVILVILLSCILVAQIYSESIQSTKISEDVIVISGGGGNITAVRTDEGILIVDSFASPQEAREARTLIEGHFPGSEIKYVINTHHHADHIWGNQVFDDAVIIGHANIEKNLMRDYAETLKEYEEYDDKIGALEIKLKEGKADKSGDTEKTEKDIARWKRIKAVFDELVPTPPDVRIACDSSLKLGAKTFEFLCFGTAHTDNDLVVLDRDDGLLIMGDLLFYRKCYIMGPHSDTKHWIALLNKLIDNSSRYEHVIPSHGPARGVGVSALEEQRDYLQALWDAVVGARQKGLTKDQAINQINLDQYKDWVDYDRIGLDIEACWIQMDRTAPNYEFPVLKGPYLGQNPPGMTPELFAPGIIVEDGTPFNAVFSPCGHEFYFVTDADGNETLDIMWMRRVNDMWTEPEVAPFNSNYYDLNLCLSPDGYRMFFRSKRPIPGTSESPKDRHYMWCTVRTDGSWSEPQVVEYAGYETVTASYQSISNDGTLYFSSPGSVGELDVHRSKFINGTYSKPENLGPSINTQYIEGDLFIAPDGRLIIVSCWNRPDNNGDSDLYISFRKSDGTWTELRNMGAPINSKASENCPMLSPDGRYFFFLSYDPVKDKRSTYWVDARIIEELKPGDLK